MLCGKYLPVPVGKEILEFRWNVLFCQCQWQVVIRETGVQFAFEQFIYVGSSLYLFLLFFHFLLQCFDVLTEEANPFIPGGLTLLVEGNEVGNVPDGHINIPKELDHSKNSHIPVCENPDAAYAFYRKNEEWWPESR